MRRPELVQKFFFGHLWGHPIISCHFTSRIFHKLVPFFFSHYSNVQGISFQPNILFFVMANFAVISTTVHNCMEVFGASFGFFMHIYFLFILSFHLTHFCVSTDSTVYMCDFVVAQHHHESHFQTPLADSTCSPQMSKNLAVRTWFLYVLLGSAGSR